MFEVVSMNWFISWYFFSIIYWQKESLILYAKNIDDKRLIASTTKIMTAILAIESGKLDDVVTIKEDILEAYGSNIYISIGEEISLKDIIRM